MKRAPSGVVPVVAVDRASPVPLYRQLYDGFRQAVLDRRLRSGERVPSTRVLAVELGISRLPLLEAFERLVAEGYLESRVGAGTFVAAAVPGAPGPERRPLAAAGRGARRSVARDTDFLLDRSSEPWLRGWGAFRVGQPASDRFPFEAWSRLVARHGRALAAGSAQPAMRYGEAMGHRPLREAIAAYLRAARSVRCEAG